jgi:hypothetical protein
MLKSLFAIACFCLPGLVFGEVRNWKSRFVEKPAWIGDGIVWATAGMGIDKKMLVAPAGVGQPWIVVDGAGTRLVLRAFVGSMPAALSENYAAWAEPSPLGAKIHRVRLADLQEEVVESDAPGALAMVVAGEAIYLLHKGPLGWMLGRVKAGRFERLVSLDEATSFYAFGECSEEEVTIVDAHGARFNVLRGPDFRNNGFVTLESERVEAAKRKKSGAVAHNGAKLYKANVVAHQRTADGHGFVIADGEKGVGQYFAEFDERGKELRQNLLRYPQGDPKKSGGYFFQRFRGKEGLLEATGSKGETATYEPPGKDDR